MTFQPINVPPSTIFSPTELKTLAKKDRKSLALSLQREQNAFLRIVRTELKAKILSERSHFLKSPVTQAWGWMTICPICQHSIIDGSLHEVLLDRGDVEGLPFEHFVQIFTPCNVVIVHESKCHLAAQHSPIGEYLCVQQIRQFHNLESLESWLGYLKEFLPGSLYEKARNKLMDIDSVAHDKVVNARIIATKEHFSRALKLIKSIPEEDRFFNDETKTWTILNPEKYRHIDFIDRAIKTRELQMRLF
jgi:hypothetical protein